jgi:hypothetical protein
MFHIGTTKQKYYIIIKFFKTLKTTTFLSLLLLIFIKIFITFKYVFVFINLFKNVDEKSGQHVNRLHDKLIFLFKKQKI